MGKSTYQISIVERGKEALWRDFWGDKPTPQALAAGEDGSLGRTEIVEACNLNEAIKMARQKHPDCVVMREACGKVG